MSGATTPCCPVLFCKVLRVALTATLVVLLSFAAHRAEGQQSDHANQDKNFDVHSSVGDLHVGKDADARSAGLPLYPGARRRHEEKDSDPLNFGVLTESFGIKLVIAKYDSDDAPGKVIDFYRDKLKKYGKVLECHTSEHGSNIRADTNQRTDKHSQQLTCEGDNVGPVTELKVGTEDNQHIVAVQPNDTGKGTEFVLVFMYTRGKQGDI